MSKTINQALKDLYLSLGGDPSALEDNSTVSDYIADLENGLKGLAELPTPSADNSGKIAKVVSNGEGGYIWGAENETSELPAPSVSNAGKIAKVVSDGAEGYVWSAENETSELPAPEVADIGKIVGVVSDGSSGAEYGLVPPGKEILIIELTETVIDADNIAKINEFFANPDKYFAYLKVTDGTYASLYPYFVPVGIGAGSSQYYINLPGIALVSSESDYYAVTITAQSFGSSGAVVATRTKLS